MAGMLVLLGVFVGVVYASTEVPSPDSITNAQTTVVYYSDGVTEMARLGDENRTNVTLDQISKPAQEAVLAAENREFYTDPGISFTGIIRAAWNNVTGGSTQGGSTITQQYVKNAILQNSDQTFGRKFQELFLAIKLDNNYSKDQILENYLNTIYYGRGAYGIESAANTYFGVPAAELTAQQGAVLAVLIRSPSRYDPEVSPEDANDRWGKVLDAMVEEGWLTAADRAASVYPEVKPKAAGSLGIPSGPEGLVVQRAIEELAGPSTATTSSRSAPVACGSSRPSTRATRTPPSPASTRSWPSEDVALLREALVAVDPKTGAVRAYYGGVSGTDFDYAQAQRQPGSSMKPYVLATALEQGISVTARRDGSSPQTFPDREGEVVNSGGASCARLHAGRGDDPLPQHDLLRPGLRGGPGERPRDGAAGPRACRTCGRAASSTARRRWPTPPAAPGPRSASVSTRCARSTRPSASRRSPAAASGGRRTSSRR